MRKGMLKAAADAVGLWDALIWISFISWAVIIAAMVAIIGRGPQR